MNVRKFKAKLKESNPELFKYIKTSTIVTDPNFEKDIAENIKRGNRCKLIKNENRGEVCYVGRVPDLGEGFYVGVKLDEPYGNTNGSINSVKYFDCPSKYGLFLRPSEIIVGDFPDLDIDEL